MTWGGLLQNIQSFAEMIIEAFSSIFQFFATQSINDILSTLIGYDVSIIDFTGVGAFSLLELMVGVGLPIMLAYSLVKWFIGIIP